MNTRFSWRTFSIYLPKHERTLSQRIFPSKLLAYINKVTTMKNRDVTHVIFDMDGLLIGNVTFFNKYILFILITNTLNNYCICIN